MKESQHADHAVIEIRVTRTANEDSPGIYIYTGRLTKKKDKTFPKENTSPREKCSHRKTTNTS